MAVSFPETVISELLTKLSGADEVFVTLINRSIAAGWLILTVVALRLLLKRAPRWISCLLWGIVAFKLICPFSFESVFSLIPSPETIQVRNVYSEAPAANETFYYYQFQSGVEVIDRTVRPVLEETGGPAAKSGIRIVTGLWLAGIGLMLAYLWFGFHRLRKTVRASICLRDNIYICDEVRSPFILGIVRPRIYLPSDLKEETIHCVIAHENTHLKRRDHWWKLLSYLLLAVYWFHPLIWVAYILFCRDMELACDEKAVRDMERSDKATYAQALLDCSFSRRLVTVYPLAFGEVGVKERVKKVLNYRKPVFWISMTAIAVCGAVAVCFLTNPKADASSYGNGGVDGPQKGNEAEVMPEADGGDLAKGEITEETLFARMPETFRFLSGTGDWSTELYLQEDGSFTGVYRDHDGSEFQGAVAPDKFPDGTVYICEFKGTFTKPEKLEDHVYSVRVQSMEYDTPGKETVKDGIRYVTDDPYGLEEGDEIWIHLPGYPVAALSEEVFHWIMIAKEYWEGIGPAKVPFFVLNNVDKGLAFFSESAGAAGTDTVGDSLQITAENLFSQMPQEYEFLSGAGAWRTELYLNEDGSFTGEHIDSDMMTVYICEFKGAFTEPKKVGDFVYSVQIQSLKYDEPGVESFVDGIQYITAEPYGLENAEEILIYLPGYPVAELPEEVFNWIRLSARQYYGGNGPEKLPFYVICNVNEQEAFVSKPRTAR